MKKHTVLAVFCLVVLHLFAEELSAQKVNTWLGGAAGRESDWFYPKNWSLGVAPDWSHDVVIPDVASTSRSYPVVPSGVIEMASLTIHSSAELQIGDSVQLDILHHELSCILGRLSSPKHPRIALSMLEPGRH